MKLYTTLTIIKIEKIFKKFFNIVIILMKDSQHHWNKHRKNKIVKRNN